MNELTKQNLALSLQEKQSLGKIFMESGLFPDIRSQAQAIVKIIAGEELGLQPMLSMQRINIIQGKVALSAEVMAYLIRRSGKYSYKIIEHTEKFCKIDFYEGKTKQGESTFSIDDAKRAGLMKAGSGWEKYPRNMLFARALSNGARWFCTDLGLPYTTDLGLPYTPEELNENEINNAKKISENQAVLKEKKISPKQLKLFWATAKNLEISDNAIITYLTSRGYKSSKDIEQSNFDEIIDQLPELAKLCQQEKVSEIMPPTAEVKSDADKEIEKISRIDADQISTIIKICKDKKIPHENLKEIIAGVGYAEITDIEAIDFDMIVDALNVYNQKEI